MTERPIERYAIVALLIAGVLVPLYLALRPKQPEIIQIFACGESCEGAAENYMVSVYQDVRDEKTCRKLRGEFWTPTSSVYFCKVQ